MNTRIKKRDIVIFESEIKYMLFVIDILGEEEIKSECEPDKELRDKEREIKKREFLYEIAKRTPQLQIVET